MPIRKLAWDKSHDPTANSQNLEDMWITPDYNYYNQHGGSGLQLTGQHYSPNPQQYTVGLFFQSLIILTLWMLTNTYVLSFIYSLMGQTIMPLLLEPTMGEGDYSWQDNIIAIIGYTQWVISFFFSISRTHIPQLPSHFCPILFLL